MDWHTLCFLWMLHRSTDVAGRTTTRLQRTLRHWPSFISISLYSQCCEMMKYCTQTCSHLLLQCVWLWELAALTDSQQRSQVAVWPHTAHILKCFLYRVSEISLRATMWMNNTVTISLYLFLYAAARSVVQLSQRCLSRSLCLHKGRWKGKCRDHKRMWGSLPHPLWSLLIPSSTRLRHTFHAHTEHGNGGWQTGTQTGQTHTSKSELS